MPLSERKKVMLGTILVLVVLLLLMLIAEGIVRTRQYIKFGSFTSLTNYGMDPATGLRIPKKGMKTKNIEINSLGFRGPEIDTPKPAARLRVGFVGASTTYCAEVSSNGMVWAELVSSGLGRTAEGLAVDYINGGVPGYSTDDSLVNLEKRILPLQPDIVVIYHASNDLSAETRDLAIAAGIGRVNLEAEASWLGRYSLLWNLVEKNLALLSVTAPTETDLLKLDPPHLGKQFRQNLKRLIKIARSNGVNLVALVTFSVHLRNGMTTEQQDAAMVSARYYFPYLSSENLLAGFKQYNQIIREVAAETDALLIGGEESIPGDPSHFKDSVHFSDAGSRLQADRILAGLTNSTVFMDIVKAKLQ